MKNLDTKQITAFQTTIWNYYHTHKRPFAWRHVNNPYPVVVSEIMLQQTQTARVAEKFTPFITRFPSFAILSQASLQEVLLYWQGLGYNRRGKYLHEIAKKVVYEHAGLLPKTPEQLITLPGIGTYTAGSICAFAYNIPTVFIETNIRTVFLQCFFANQTGIHDKQLMPLIEQTLDKSNPRDWYYALMDYGVELKKQLPNPSRRSAHHAKQSKFEGSDRQIRGIILKLLTKQQSVSKDLLFNSIDREPQRIEKALASLHKDQMITVKDNHIIIA